MDIILRLEQEKDIDIVERLTRKAFWRDERIEKIGIGCDEHYLAHTLRLAPEFVKELNFVAEIDGELVGNIMYSLAHVELEDGSLHEVLNFGPLSVLSSVQKQGVGSALMHHSLEVAKRLGYGAVIFFGHPTYYPRFGFKEAKEFHITTKEGKNFPAFMAMELIEGDLADKQGKFHESPLFEVNSKKAILYDKQFQNPLTDGENND